MEPQPLAKHVDSSPRFLHLYLHRFFLHPFRYNVCVFCNWLSSVCFDGDRAGSVSSTAALRCRTIRRRRRLRALRSGRSMRWGFVSFWLWNWKELGFVKIGGIRLLAWFLQFYFLISGFDSFIFDGFFVFSCCFCYFRFVLFWCWYWWLRWVPLN